MRILKSSINSLSILAKTQTAKNTYLTSFSYIINGFAVLIFNLVCSRLLGPSSFGVFSIALTIYLVTYNLFGFGIDQGMIRFIAFYSGKNNLAKAHAFAKFALLFRIIAGVLIACLGFTLSDIIANQIFHLPDLALLLKLTFLGELGLGLLSWLVRFFMGQQDFKRVAIFESTKGSLRLIFLAVLFISAHLNSFWATAAYTLTPLIIFILGFMTISKTFFKAKITPDVITKLIHFSKWLFIWEATATFHSRIDVLMLARFKTSFDVGIYSVASGIIVGFIWLISAFSNVLAPKLSQIQTQTQFVKIIKKSLIGVSAIFFLIVLSFIFAKPIIILLFSSVYEKSIPAFQILCLGIAFFSLNTPFMSSLYAIGKSKSIAILSIFQLFLLILFNLFTIPTFGILGPAITFAAVNLIILLMTIYLIFIPFKKGVLVSK